MEGLKIQHPGDVPIVSVNEEEAKRAQKPAPQKQVKLTLGDSGGLTLQLSSQDHYRATRHTK